MKQVMLYTDGGCLGNPGPGGYGVVLVFNSIRKELSGGFRHTTNNRMEIYAAIAGLEALKEPCKVNLVSDSQYVVNAIEKGWARQWQKKGWKRKTGEPAINPDLWEKLLKLCDIHDVTFQWIRGHAGHPENERCDVLAKSESAKPNQPIDPGYEKQ
jgi:ribonuclease HI